MHKKIEIHELNLRQFIDSTSRWPIAIQNNGKFVPPPFLENHMTNASNYLYDFSNQLRIEFDKPENGKGFEIDIIDKFLPSIRSYYLWYENKREEIEKKLGIKNLYSFMLDNMIFTEREINKYFPQEVKPKKTINLRQTTSTFKGLFKQKKDYDDVVKLLIENGFIHENENDSLTWKGDVKESSLTDKTSLCTLGVVLNEKNYFKPNLKNNTIASTLTNTFNLNISPQRYGDVKKGATHKSSDYETSFHFINTL